MRPPLAPLAVAALLAATPASAQDAPAPDSGRAAAPDLGGDAGGSGIAPPGVTIQRLDLTRTPVVEARVTVVDGSGAWLHGLRPDEFVVRLDGEPLELGGDRARLASRFVDGERVTVVAVVDVSGSMRDALPEIRLAIADFAARLGEDDEIGLVAVADAPRVPIPPGADRTRLTALLDSLPIGGNTAILDAVVSGLDALAERAAPRRALIVLTDGVDNRSAATVEEAAAAARDRGIPIYAVALGADADTAAMGALATASGGRMLLEAEPAGLRRIYADLAGLLASEYRLTLDLDDAAVGRWHDLSVGLVSIPAGLPAERAAAARPFLATRTPGVDRGLVREARAERDRGRMVAWWALGSMAALVPVLGGVLLVHRSRRAALRPAAVGLSVALAAAIGGALALLGRVLGG